MPPMVTRVCTQLDLRARHFFNGIRCHYRFCGVLPAIGPERPDESGHAAGDRIEVHLHSDDAGRRNEHRIGRAAKRFGGNPGHFNRPVFSFLAGACIGDSRIGKDCPCPALFKTLPAEFHRGRTKKVPGENTRSGAARRILRTDQRQVEPAA